MRNGPRDHEEFAPHSSALPMTALVFGNADYPDHQLSNPANDAVDLGTKLLSYGFNVIVATDCAIKLMEKRLKELAVANRTGSRFNGGPLRRRAR